MVSAPSVPAPPDPAKTAAAQTGTNVDTAIANSALSHTNQYTPDGSLTYTQTGTTTMKDASGHSYTLPTYSAYQTLSDANQKIYDTSQATKQQLGQLGLDESKRISDLLATPIDLSADATQSKLMDLGRQRLDPMFAQQSAALDQKLADQGISQGSEAWNNAERSFNQGKNDAYNNLVLNGWQQAQQQAIAERSQPINEITALMSGSQVSQPNFTHTPTTQLPTVDYAGIINNNYNQQMQAYNAQAAQSSAGMGGLFGLGSSLLSLWSDRRLKRDIKKIGTLPSGLNVYSYRYVWGGPEQQGVMADEVRAVIPHAVIEDASGFLKVDYSQVR